MVSIKTQSPTNLSLGGRICPLSAHRRTAATERRLPAGIGRSSSSPRDPLSKAGWKPALRHLADAPTRRCNGRWLLHLAMLLAGTLPLAAHVGAPPLSSLRAVRPIAVVQRVELPPTDPAAELAADAKTGRTLPLRYAVARPLRVTPQTHGTWEDVPEGRLWRFRVSSSAATDINLGFSKFWLPAGATLHMISEGEDYYQGPYTAADNSPAEQLWTPVVPGEAVIIELLVPTGTKEDPRLVLTHVGTGYRDLFHRQKAFSIPKAESCEMDVVCPVAAPWANEIQSVGRISIGGTALCSGTLLMDAPGDFRAFFLTANHCGITTANAATVVVYWNYQSPTCGLHGLGALANNTQSGATFRASKSDVDFCLIELNQLPPASYNIYYAGWDRSGTAPTGCVGIHHPNGDGKCISFSGNPLITVDNCIGTGGTSTRTHWQVVWSSGVTEPGSSGSAIWDAATRQVVGSLSGGDSDCSTPFGPDCYGKFSMAWASGSTAASRLRDWLDPLNTGMSSVAGSYTSPVAAVTAAGTSLVEEGCPPTNGVVDPGEVVTISFSLQNTGTAPTTNLVASLLATNGVVAPSGPQAYGVLAAHGAAVARSFTFMATGACGGTIVPTLRLQDGAKDLGKVSFSLPLGLLSSVFSENFDAVAAPDLPPGWASSPSGGWITTPTQQDTPPNAAFASDGSSVADYQLTSPPIAISSTNAQLTFRNYYDTESGYDGGVLEISINGGAFSDILAAGGSFISGAYNGTISSSYSNPLAGRSAWTGNSANFLTTTAVLPPKAAGSSIQLRWRLGTDSSVSAMGWYVGAVTVGGDYVCCTGAPPTSLSAMLYHHTKQSFQFNVTGGSGYSYTVLASTNLSNWIALQTNTSPFMFIDSNATLFPQRFYRTRYP